MKRIPLTRAFSLIELLLGIAVIAIVAAVIVPKFLSVQSQANNAVMQQMSDQLTSTYANWKAAGGSITGLTTAYTGYGSVILTVLSGKADVAGSTAPASATAGGVTVTDPPIQAGQIRLDLPVGATIDPSNPSNVVFTNNYSIIFSPATETFQVLPKGAAYISNGSAAGGYPNFQVMTDSGYLTYSLDGRTQQTVSATGMSYSLGVANSVIFWASDKNGNPSGNITYIYTPWENLIDMNLGGCLKLGFLGCGSNSLKSLNISGLTGLYTCNCNINQLTSINVTGCTSLTRLQCDHNNLGPIYLGGRPTSAFTNSGLIYTPQNAGHTASLQ
jgi:prepilin-type N-terminal cleavage/methylation domain-containing protein